MDGHPKLHRPAVARRCRLLFVLILLNAGLVSETCAEDQYLTPHPPRRLALVMGNSDYTDLAKLSSAARDSEEMTKLLESLDFKVTTYNNFPTRANFLNNAFVPFTTSILEGDIVVFYFSGHGFSYGGESFLAPLSFDIPAKSNEVFLTFLSVTGLLGHITERKPSLVIMILDACRSVANFIQPVEGDDPQSVEKGLAPVRAYLENSSIIYSSDAGAVSIGSSDDKLSIFTEAIMKYAPVSEQKTLDKLKKEIRLYVRQKTQNKQTPWVSESSSAEFYLQHSPEVIQEQRSLWEKALAEGTRTAVEWYLGLYGTGVYALAARRWLKDHQSAPDVRTSRTPASAIEDAWLATGDATSFSVTSGPVTFPAFEAEATAAFTYADEYEAAPWPGSTATADETLESSIGLEVVVSQAADARREPRSNSSVAAPIAANTTVRLEEVLRNESDELWLKVRLPSDQSAYVQQDDSTDEVFVGKPLLQLTLTERQRGIRALVDEGPLLAALKEFKAGDQKIYWASIAIPAPANEAEEALFGLRAVSLRQTLDEAGIARDRVTVLKEPTVAKGEVRIRFFGEDD